MGSPTFRGTAREQHPGGVMDMKANQYGQASDFARTVTVFRAIGLPPNPKDPPPDGPDLCALDKPVTLHLSPRGRGG